MSGLIELYRHSLALLTDLYQLTMAYGYWKSGTAEKEAVFHLVFRNHPFGGQFTIACGLSYVIDFIKRFHFDEDDLAYMATLTGGDGAPLLDAGFLDYLRQMQFCCDVDAVVEGTAVFPHEPLVRVRGPILQSQLLETPLLTILNFQSLIATKAARVCMATGGEPVLEFGLRRAQGVDGGVTASRAAFVGGCDATSNVLAGKLFDIPVRGTHAHSWIMSFDSERESFDTYAQVLPNNCVFLVDTYDTLAGVRHAVQVGHELRQRGHEMIGIRLDSGDLGRLSIQSRRILDEAGFDKATIVASGDLDEYRIGRLKRAGARIDVWGVGTRLATAYDQPALGGVYKLSAVRSPGEPWQYKLKLSEERAKSSGPGILQVRRFHKVGRFLGDVIYDEPTGIEPRPAVVDLADETRRTMPNSAAFNDLLVPVFRGGRAVYDAPPVIDAQRRTKEQIAQLAEQVKRLDNPQRYPVGLQERLHQLKLKLVAEAEAEMS